MIEKNRLEPCPTCKNDLSAFKIGPSWKISQSVRIECGNCGFRYTFFQIYDIVPKLTPTVWKTLASDGTTKQEYYVPRKHDLVLSTINRFLKSV